MRRVDVVEQTKFNAGRVFGKNRKVDAVAEPGRAERVRFSGPGLYRCHKRDVLISHANTTRNPRFFARLAEFVAQKNRQRPQTDRARNNERAWRGFWHGEEQEERLHCFGWRV